ncbi:MAG: hypothetical protein CR993_01755 [Rhodobacterales bacterium]|nr:MAG: hypothetical protein CR993_01755 [Rhodobacterales bacterium]
MRIIGFVLGIFLWASASVAQDCTPTNFRTVPIAPLSPDAAINSLLNGYPDLRFDAETAQFIAPSGARLAYTAPTDRPAQTILTDATIGDQFRYRYPLNFDLTARQTPWHDPGRVRNDAFLRFLYGDSKSEVRASLTQVQSPDGRARFRVTRRHGVDCQLRAALAEIGTAYPKVFSKTGGSFNWRFISGTNRMSVHSFGAAIDLNTEMGGYWKWSGAKAGAVGDYRNQIPKAVVSALETYGFIWGGKWHHFDGMHFEYRPELILFARLTAEEG